MYKNIRDRFVMFSGFQPGFTVERTETIVLCIETLEIGTVLALTVETIMLCIKTSAKGKQKCYV